MASFLEFSETVNKDDIMPAYRKLLTDINYCLNLFEELEAGRTYRDTITDLIGGNKDSINLNNTRSHLEKLKGEIERGVGLYTHLFIKMIGVKKIEESYQQRVEEMQQSSFDQSLFLEHQNEFIKKIHTDFYKLSQANIKDTGPSNTGLMGSATGTVGTEVPPNTGLPTGLVALERGGAWLAITASSGLTFITSLISKIAYDYANNKAKCRDMKYQELKQLSEALHDNAMLGIFQSHHSTIENILLGMDSIIETWDKHLEMRSMNSPKMAEESSSSDNTIKATRVYDKALSDTYEMLEGSEPGMQEDVRKRIASNAAATACKIYLKETLRYSDSDADKFIENL